MADAQVKLLLDEFAGPEIVELLMWISFEYARQMFGCLIGDEPGGPRRTRCLRRIRRS
jgi:hypothetical protein